MTTEADPLPVALPELPTVAYTWKNLSVGPAGTIIDEIGFRAPGYIPTSQLDCLVRKSDAEAALRAQAEEVAALRAVLADTVALLFAVRCEIVHRPTCASLMLGQIDRRLDSASAHLASKQEKPHG